MKKSKYGRNSLFFQINLMLNISSTLRTALFFLLYFVSCSVLSQSETGRLILTIIDSETDTATPARVEILGSDGKTYIASDAILVGGDCDMTNEGGERLHSLDVSLGKLGRSVKNPLSKTTQFYSAGLSNIDVPLGLSKIRVFKGPEYNIYEGSVNITAESSTSHQVSLSRRIDMRAEGWFSADDHLHIARPVKELNPFISKVLQAEDIHVGNLLQMGKGDYFSIAPQYAHGKKGLYQEGQYILASGQENPRTDMLGHSITLGAEIPIHYPEVYLVYRHFWEEAVKQGAINGAAHFGSHAGGNFGLPIILPHDLLHFMEVLSFNSSDYDLWYDILNLGYQVSPTAGSDFPCASILGHERFYTKVEGVFSYSNWLDGIRNGNTFVTTGPLLEFKVNGNEMGSKISLKAPSIVNIAGSVSFDVKRDNLHGIELIENGKVIGSFPRIDLKDRITFKVKKEIVQSGWLAIRSYYRDWNELNSNSPLSIVHSAPVYIDIASDKKMSTMPEHKKAAIRVFLARLEDLEKRLSVDDIDKGVGQLLSRYWAYVPEQTYFKNKDFLLKEIADAKRYFNGLQDNQSDLLNN